MGRFPEARDDYAAWPLANRQLGAVHLTRAAPNVWIASMVAQVGYGPSPTGQPPRLHVRALQQALEQLSSDALKLEAGVHMPLIGTGQGGMRWPNVRDLILEELAGRHIPVTVYVLPDAPMPEEASDAEQMVLL